MLEAVANRSPGAPAVTVVGGPGLTYRQLLNASARVAGGLRADGVRRGDRVGLLLGNGIEWCLAFFGAMCAGAVPVPVNTRFAPPEIDHVLQDAGVRMAIAPATRCPRESVRRRDTATGRSRMPDLHEWDNGGAEGRDADARQRDQRGGGGRP